MSSKTQLNQHITRQNQQLSEQAKEISNLKQELDWANKQVGGLTSQLKEAKKTWWKKTTTKLKHIFK